MSQSEPIGEPIQFAPELVSFEERDRRLEELLPIKNNKKMFRKMFFEIAPLIRQLYGDYANKCELFHVVAGSTYTDEERKEMFWDFPGEHSIEKQIRNMIQNEGSVD